MLVKLKALLKTALLAVLYPLCICGYPQSGSASPGSTSGEQSITTAQSVTTAQWITTAYAASGIESVADALPESISQPTQSQSPSDELKSMYTQDQDERQRSMSDPASISWDTISAHDKQHHERVLELLSQEKLASGDDYFYAAMIMQHGQKPKDYILAHVLAEAAAMLGNKAAVWLSAASFDRLMQSTKQPQVFGTQFLGKDDMPYHVTEPYAPEMIPDSVRRLLHVPTLSENEARLKKMNDSRIQKPEKSKTN